MGSTDPGFACRPAAEPDADARQHAGKLFAKPCTFVTGAVSAAGMPTEDRIEACFAGRSNVGKSTLLNALVARRSLARASNTPGRTREVNFFALGPAHYLVDLPGYGYARMPKRTVRQCRSLIHSYLLGRTALRRAYLLIDARHGPKAADFDFMALLQNAGVSFQIVVTKADKIRSSERSSLHQLASKAIAANPAGLQDVIVTSATVKHGIDILRTSIASLR